jgi:hypothetical protein
MRLSMPREGWTSNKGFDLVLNILLSAVGEHNNIYNWKV